MPNTVTIHGLVQVPPQETTAPQPPLSPEVRALLSTASCVVLHNGFTWNMTRKGKTYACSRHLDTFNDWKAQVAAVVEATG